MRVLSVGEILWDVFPERELLGGAPLNFSAHLARLGHMAYLLSAVGQDERGLRACEAANSLGVGTDFLHVVSGFPTGTAFVSTTATGEPRFEIQRPAAFDRAALSQREAEDAKAMQPDWMYFGTLLQTVPSVEGMTRELAQNLPGVRCFYDMNLRSGCWNFPLVHRLCEMATVLKLNEAEAEMLGEEIGLRCDPFSLEEFCRACAARYELASVCVTLGAAGCMVFEGGIAYRSPGFPATVRDTVGAGDAFAAAFLHGRHANWPVPQAARFANALGSIVASREGAVPPWSLEECVDRASMPNEGVNLQPVSLEAIL